MTEHSAGDIFETFFGGDLSEASMRERFGAPPDGPPAPAQNMTYVLTSSSQGDLRTVYFVQARPSCMVKIGLSEDIYRRLRHLRAMSPEDLHLVAYIPRGGQATEAALHRRFAYARAHGEWFRPVPELLAVIREVQQLHNADEMENEP